MKSILCICLLGVFFLTCRTEIKGNEFCLYEYKGDIYEVVVKDKMLCYVKIKDITDGKTWINLNKFPSIVCRSKGKNE